jgi:hypothetical protein
LKAKRRRKEKKQFEAYKEFKQKLEASERNYSTKPRDRGESESSSTVRHNQMANFMTVEGRESEMKILN